MHNFAQSWTLNVRIETSLRRGGVSSLEAHDWRFPSTEDELLPKRRKSKKSLPPLATTITCSPVITHNTSCKSASLSGLSGHLCGRHSGVRGGGDAATLTGTLSPSGAEVGGGGGGGGRVMSPVDSHDYHYDQFPFFSAYFSFFCPSTHLVSSLRPLGLFLSVILHRCTVSRCRPSLADVHRA